MQLRSLACLVNVSRHFRSKGEANLVGQKGWQKYESSPLPPALMICQFPFHLPEYSRWSHADVCFGDRFAEGKLLLLSNPGKISRCNQDHYHHGSI